jgi:ribonucleoside-triphosphate reductase (thioredoxin)
MSRKNINDIFTISDELPFNTIGLFTFLRTYARRHEEDNPNSTVESWQETLQRVVLACNSQLKVGFTDAEMKELFNLLYNLKCSVAGRFLWQLGTKTVDKLGLPSLQNCAATVIDEPVRPFTWAMNFLMLGCVPPGTPILTESGIKKISSVKIGDKVWSYNIDTDKRELKTVTELHSPVIPKDLNIRLHGKYGSLTTSKKHPILVYRDNKWDYVLAGEIKQGDIVHRYHESFTDKDEISSIEDNLDIPEDWCDITVKDNNNYYAGEGSLYCTHNCGVGFRILPSDVEKIPQVKYAHNVRKDTNDADFVVPDSREGWVKLLGKVLKSHFYSGESFTYSCTLLRSKGAPIKGFGGLASGPEVLCQGMTKIDEILNTRAGKNLRPIDALDIMNIIGMVVVSGNVRRSALIALGDVKDSDYLMAKRWDLGNIPNYRAYSNNSIVCNDIADILDNDDFWQGYHGNGEPYGLINLALSQSCGRLGETQYPDPDVIGYNPCAEQSLTDKETCCLSELYLPNISSKEELFKCATYVYRICKHSLTLPCEVSKETENIVRKNMRMGIGVTGYLQATDEQRSWLSDCYHHLREYDKDYSSKHGFPVSIKLATVKPAGTLSLLGGVTSGVHPGFARYYKRRIRIASESPLIKLAKDHGYHVEYVKHFDGSIDHTTQIVTFPCRLPDNTVLAEDCTAVDQLEWVKKLQTEWSDNSVSVTVYYRKHEIPDIKEWLRKNYNNSVKTVSFLLHSDHGFQQAPLEQITKDEYEELVKECKPIKSVAGICFSDEDESLIGQNECVGGACPLR